MTDRLTHCHQLSQVLDEHITAASLLLKTLAEEKQLLAGADVAKLTELDGRKRTQLSQTEHLEQQRRALCQHLSIGPDAAAMDVLLNELGSTGHEDLQRTLHTQWLRMREVVAKCRDANEVNGMIAQSKQRQLLQLLGILRDGGRSGTTYDPTGAKSQTTMGSRALGQV